MIKFYKSNTPGIVEKHTIELIDITVLEKELAEKQAQIQDMSDTMTAAEIESENQMRMQMKQQIQIDAQTLTTKIAVLKAVKDIAPKEI